MPTYIPSVWRWGLSGRKKSPKAVLLWQGFSSVSLLFIALPFLKKDKVVWFNTPDSHISVWDLQITGHALVPSCTTVICPGTHNRCPRHFKSHLHSISRQKDRLSLGKPEHTVALRLCANSIQPWTVSSYTGKWRQVPGKQSREQPSGRWGWQDCPGCDLLVHCTLSISGCCPSLVGRGRSCVTPEVLPG